MVALGGSLILQLTRQQFRTFVRTIKVQNLQQFSVTEILRDGRHSSNMVSIEEIVKKSNKKLPLRDLRILYKGENGRHCSILPRPQSNCIIMELESLRLLCWTDKCILLNNKTKLHEQFLNEATTSLTDGNQRTSELSTVLKLYQKSSEAEGVEFELKILESALAVTVAKFQRHLDLLKPAVDLLLQQIAADPHSAMLRRLLAVKKSLGDYESNVKNVSKTIQNLLGNDEDMTALYLTNKDRQVDEHEEVELLLESYLADLEDIQSQVKIIKDTIEDTNQFIGAHLDATRNRMIRMSLFMEMGTLSLGSGALIAGIFGMNLTHGLEEHPLAFYITCAGVSILMTSIFFKFRSNYMKLRFDTTSAYSFMVLKNFLSYVDKLEDIVSSGNSEITETEFKQALDKLVGQKVPPEESEFIFQMFDRNKDRKLSTSTELKI